MSPDELIEHYPQLYHMAEAETWESIKTHGLLSTTGLLDLFEINGPDRYAIESCRRPECVTINHPVYGKVLIRDQKPMSDGALRKCLRQMKPRDWYELLNRRVFFWLDWGRLIRLLRARAYRSRIHCVLTVDTEKLLKQHLPSVTLSPINSGSTIFNPQQRGRQTFLTPENYPFQARRDQRGIQNAVVELAVDYGVKEIANMTVSVNHMKGDQITDSIWARPARS